ncbi:MAG: M28 family peptidase [Actinomycetota bacterium]|nr:M28 family peptidase [Actinomycetota bacterium]
MSTATQSSGPRVLARARRQHALGVARALPIDVPALRRMVQELSTIGSRSDGFRVTGTPEDLHAATLASEWMREAGLQAVELEEVTVDGWRLGNASLTLNDERVILGASLGGTPGTHQGGISAPLVDVATGERRHLDRLDVAGRIALMDWHSLSVTPADRALELGLRGAVGLVVASFEGGPLYQTPGAVGSFDSHWHSGAPPILTISREDAALLRAKLRSQPVSGRLKIDVTLTYGAVGTNALGWMEGTDSGAPIVIGAHHDGWFSAAFDNASGVAALIALASGLADLGYRPRHTLCFTSRTAEEYGLAQAPFDWCAGAWLQVSERHPEWGAESPFHLCLEASGHPALRSIVEAPVELAGWARSVCRAADAEGWLTSGWRVGPPVTGTEQWPFLVAGVPGVASYCWETAFRRHTYHTPLDTPDLIDFDHLARLIRLNALLLIEADTDPEAIHDHGARARRIVKVAAALGADGESLARAAHIHGHRRGRETFTAVGRELHAIDAHGEIAYPHTQAAADASHLDAALVAVRDGDDRRAIRALEAVGSNRLTRVLGAEAFALHQAREQPDAPRLSWAAASHLTVSPNLWAELATLRGERGSRPSGPWLEASLRRHRAQVQRELRLRTQAMARALNVNPSEAL